MAQVAIPDEYSKTITHHNEIATLTGDFAGDSIDLSTGRLSILQTDIDLPGNNALPVRVARQFRPGDTWGTGHFGNWTMDLPYIRGTFFRGTGGNWHWEIEGGGGARCTNYGAPPTINYIYATWDPSEYWYGNTLHLPGGSDSELLLNGGNKPAGGGSYPVGTKEGHAGRCVPLASTSVSGATGEGFEIVTTDGVVYTLNQMVTSGQSTLKKSSYTPESAARTSRTGATSMTTLAPVTPVLPREDVILFPTSVTDRFGNSVAYQWSTTNPWQLLHIVASDGRHLDFTYESATSARVTSVTDGAHTWSYTYTTSTDTMTQPDGGVWTYQLRDLFNLGEKPTGTFCGTVNGVSSRSADSSTTPTSTGTMTGPSGATVTLGMSRVLLGRSYAPYECYADGDDAALAYMRYPYLFVSAAVVSKKITGPGLPVAGLSWNYVYGPTNNCWNTTAGWAQGVLCTGSSPTTRQVTVTAPAGEVTRYTFGNKYNDTEGMLQRTEYGWNGTTALRTVDVSYASAIAAPYVTTRGESIRLNGDEMMTGYLRPQSKVVTQQQGRTFTWEVAADCAGVPLCFDAFARPTKVIKTSTTP